MFGNFILTECGAFDSNVKFTGCQESPSRLVEEFEIEFYSENTNNFSYINRQKHKLFCGSLVCAKPGQTRHSTLPFRCYYLHFHTADESLKAFLRSLPDVMNFSKDSGLDKIFGGILRECTDYQTKRSSAYKLAGHIYSLFAFLDEHTLSGKFTPDVLPGGRQADILAVSEYIREHLAEKLSLERLAEIANLSPVYFHKLFTKYYLKTPAQYVLESRIAAAKIMLISSDLSVGAVAERCGFSSQNYLNTCFKKITGFSPLRYKREMLSKADM